MLDGNHVVLVTTIETLQPRVVALMTARHRHGGYRKRRRRHGALLSLEHHRSISRDKLDSTSQKQRGRIYWQECQQ